MMVHIMSGADEPMKSLIQQLAQQARATFLPLSRGHAPSQLDQLTNLTQLITAKDLNFDPQWVQNQDKYQPSDRTPPVTYVHIYEDHIFSLGIFIIRNGYSLPLHDHPNMYGICKVIHGKVKITAYSHTQPRPIPESLLVHGLLLSPTMKEEKVVGTDSCCCLSPINGNFHQIEAIEGPAAFMDILAPPYDNGGRNCHYYKEVLKEASVTWLKMVPQPASFWCSQKQYCGPCVEIDY